MDPKGLTVPGAVVVVHNTDTGSDRTLTSNDAGIYVATFLQPGHYEVNASKPGLAKVVRNEITLQVGQTLTVDVSMPLESAQGSVTVTGESAILETENTAQSQEVSQSLVENLPIAGRRWDNFVLLTPGVTNDGGSGLVSFRGISGLYNNNSVDGANNNQAFFSEARGRAIGVPYVYSLDSIKEFQVSSSNYSAEFGQAAGGVVNAVTKSGTNLTHGDLFYYLRYPSFNALDPGEQSRRSVYAARASAATVRRQRGRPDHQGQAVLFRHLRWLPQGFPDHLHVSSSVFPAPLPGFSDGGPMHGGEWLSAIAHRVLSSHCQAGSTLRQARLSVERDQPHQRGFRL